MYIIVGLGNPDKEYENTRHNTGFMTIDALASKCNISINKNKHKALIGDGSINGEKVLLVKPQTYMNLSGDSVVEIVNFYKESIDNLIIVFDDIDIPLGKIRIKNNGSAGTHNGMKSIVNRLNTQDFKRIKVGIGKNDGIDLISYVLGKFSAEERKLLDGSIDNAVNAIIKIVEDKNTVRAMNEYNS